MKYSSSRWYPYLVLVASNSTTCPAAITHTHPVMRGRAGLALAYPSTRLGASRAGSHAMPTSVSLAGWRCRLNSPIRGAAHARATA